MARRLQAYLHQNRLGTFNFRWRPPRDVADCFAQSAFEFSLATKNRSEAWPRALSVPLRVRELVASMRAKTMAKEKPLTFKLVRSIVLPDRTEHRIDYDPNDPAEVAEADRIVNAIQREAPPMPATPDAAAPPLPRAPSARQPAVCASEVKISAAFATCCEEKARLGRLEGSTSRPTLRSRTGHR